jgi:hypothetical protein
MPGSGSVARSITPGYRRSRSSAQLGSITTKAHDGALSVEEMMVIFHNAFETVTSALVYKGELKNVIDSTTGARTGSLLPHMPGTTGGDSIHAHHGVSAGVSVASIPAISHLSSGSASCPIPL